MLGRRTRRVISILLALALPVALGLPAAGQSSSPPNSGGSSQPPQRNEVEGKRNRFSKTFRHPDGSYTSEIYTSPIHFKNAQGRWEEIDPTLVECRRPQCAYENRKGSWLLEFAPTAADEKLVHVRDTGAGFALGAAGANPGSRPVVDGTEITYPEAYAGVDLVFESRNADIKGTIVLNGRPDGALRFVMPLSLDNLEAHQNERGEIILRDRQGDVRFTIPQMWMEDSNQAGNSGDGAMSEDVAMELHEAGGRQFITVTPDLAWLMDPERVYPVMIDPSFSGKTPTLDTFVQSNIQNTPQSTSDELKSGYYSGPEGTFTTRSLLKFDMSVIPNGAQISEGTLKLYEKHSYSCSTRIVDVYRITESWGENVLWSTKPAFAGSPTDSKDVAKGYSSACPNDWVQFNVASAIQYMKNNPDVYNHGFGIRARNESDTYGWKKFASDQATNKPQLSVTWNTPPWEPVPQNPLEGDTTGPTPTLKATYRDADDGDWGRVEFQVWHGADCYGGECSGTPVITIAEGQGTAGNPGHISTYQVPPNTLNDGPYKWRGRGNDGKHTGPWSTLQRFVVEVTPPPPPTITASPASPSNDRTPTWSFSGQSGNTFECRLFRDGVVLFGFAACSSPKTYDLSAQQDGTYRFEVRQTNSYGKTSTPTASPDYVLDTKPPGNPTITDGPPEYSNDQTPTWSFSGETGTTFECALNRGTTSVFAAAACTSPKTYDLSAQSDGAYTFRVRQKDAAGNFSAWVERSYNLDRTAPSAPTITASPASPSSNRNPSWSFSGEGGASFQCRLTEPGATSPAFSACSSPKSYDLSGKPDGDYTFEVRQVDRAGNGSTPARSVYTLDSQVPAAPTITEAPPPYSNDATPTWAFSGEAGAKFECELRRDTLALFGVSACTSPKTYDLSAEPDGAYTFGVRQTDRAGNVSAFANSSYVLDRQKPGEPTGVKSTSHVPNVPMKDTTIDVSWEPPLPPDPSGIKGYSWAFRAEVQCDSSLLLNCHQGDPSPADGSVNGGPNERSVTSPPLDKGRYWFHVRAVDRAGNVGEEVVYGPMIIDPEGSPIPLTPTLGDELVAQSDENGLEQFYPYRSTSLGPPSGYVQLHSGNLVVQTADVRIPGHGLNAVINHTYNSDRHDRGYHDTGVGRGWTLSLSDIESGLVGSLGGAVAGFDLNTPVAVSEATVDVALGTTGKIVEFTDGDGTVHRFVRHGGADAEWQAPPGVDLKLREITDSTGAVVEAYHFVRPDGVVYEATRPTVIGETVPVDTWHVTSIRERDGFGSGNGNWLKFEYRRVDLTNNLTNPLGSVRMGWVTHRQYPHPVLCARYDNYGNLDTLISLPERGPTPGLTEDPDSDCQQAPGGRSRVFDYEVDPQKQHLLRVTHNAHTTEAQGKRTVAYDYKDTALPLPLTPLERQEDLLKGVTDARNHRTAFRYGDDTGKVRLTKIIDREHKEWTYRYEKADPNTGNRETIAVTPGPSGETRYLISAREPISESDKRYAGANILRITDAGNNQGPVVKRYEWDKNLLTKKIDGAGAETLMEYNALGLVTKVVSPSPNQPGRNDLPAGAHQGTVTTLLRYDTSRFATADMERLTVAAGTGQQRVTDFVVDSDTGNLRSVTRRAHANGDPNASEDRTTSFTYYPDTGAIRTVNGPRTDVSDETTYSNYEPSGLPRTITDAFEKSKQFEYTPYGMVLQETDRFQKVTRYTYDDRDNRLSMVDAEQHKTTYTYDGNDNMLTETSPRGNQTQDVPDDHQTRYEYDHNDREIVMSEPGQTNAGPRRTTRTTYNPDGTKKHEDNPVGARTAFDYWPNQALKSETAPAGTGDTAVTSYSYDAAGRVNKIVRPEVNDRNQRPVESVVYSPAGTIVLRQETSSSGQLDRETRMAYNAHGEELESLGPRTVGGVKEAVRRAYNPFGETTRVSRRLNADRWLDNTFTYDQAGNRIESTQPTADPSKPESERILRTTYTYDRLNRLVRETDPVNPGHTTEYTHLPEGQQETRTDLADGNPRRTVRHTYNDDYTERSIVATDHTKDGSPTLATCNWAEGQSPASGYDADDNLLHTRTVKGSTGCEGGHTIRTQTFTYDHRSWIESTTQKLDPFAGDGNPAVSRTQSFTYRDDGAVKTSKWGDKTSAFRYSSAGWLEGATDWRAGAAESTFSLQPSGAWASVVLGADARAAYDYHPDGSMSSLAWTKTGGGPIRSHTSIAYDVGGQRIGESVEITRPEGELPTTDSGGRATFDYDLVGRLTQWTSPFRYSATDAEPTTNYTLDDGGNITLEKKQVGDSIKKKTTSVYEHGRLATRTVDEMGTTTPTKQCMGYTRLGEEKTRRTVTSSCDDNALTTLTTTYDPAGHTDDVESATLGLSQSKISYVYDQDKVMARKKNDEVRLFFYWGDTSQLIEETDASGNSKVTYFRTPEGTGLAQQRDGKWTWLLEDPHGSVAAHLKKNDDGSTTITSQQAFDPYGAPDEGREKEASNTSSSTLGFQGAHTDEETDRILLGPRQYDPKTQRFTTADFFVQGPADLKLGSDPLTGNRYLFAAANPVAFYDDGHQPRANGGGGSSSRRGSSSGGDSSSAGGSSSDDDGWFDPWAAATAAGAEAIAISKRFADQGSAAGADVQARVPGSGARLSRFSHDPVMKHLGRALRNPWIRGAARGVAVIGGAATLYDNFFLEEGNTPGDAVVESGVELGIAGGVGLAVGALCSTGVGCLVGGALAVGAVSGFADDAGEFVSDHIGDEVDSALDSAGDIASDVGDFITEDLL